MRVHNEEMEVCEGIFYQGSCYLALDFFKLTDPVKTFYLFPRDKRFMTALYIESFISIFRWAVSNSITSVADPYYD